MDLDFTFSPLPISHCVAYIVALSDQNRINTPHLASPKGRQLAHSSPSILCAFLGNCSPFLYLVLSLFALPCYARSSDLIPPIATCHSCSQTRAFRSPVISSPLRLDRHPVTHTCGSGNNKPRTLPLSYSHVVPPSGTSLGFYFFCAFLNSHVDSHSAIHPYFFRPLSVHFPPCPTTRQQIDPVCHCSFYQSHAPSFILLASRTSYFQVCSPVSLFLHSELTARSPGLAHLSPRLKPSVAQCQTWQKPCGHYWWHT